ALERLGTGAGIKLAEKCGDTSTLPRGLIAGDERPVAADLKQATTFGRERLAALRIRHLRQVWLKVLGAAVRRANVNQTAVNAAIGADILAPRLFAVGQLTEPAPEDVVLR